MSTWDCPSCTLKNPGGGAACTLCGKLRNTGGGVVAGPKGALAPLSTPAARAADPRFNHKLLLTLSPAGEAARETDVARKAAEAAAWRAMSPAEQTRVSNERRLRAQALDPNAPLPNEYGNWACPLCTTINPAGKKTCVDCNKIRGEWTCPACTTVNLAEKIMCTTCDKIRPIPVPGIKDEWWTRWARGQAAPTHKIKDLDMTYGAPVTHDEFIHWLNEARFSFLIESEIQFARLYHSRWKCSARDCNFINLISEYNCANCGTKQPSEPASLDSAKTAAMRHLLFWEERTGLDPPWVCSFCNSVQDGRNSVCDNSRCPSKEAHLIIPIPAGKVLLNAQMMASDSGDVIYANWRAMILGEKCTLCNENFKNGGSGGGGGGGNPPAHQDNEEITTECNHTFHKNCIIQWRKRNNNKNVCPWCKKTIPTYQGGGRMYKTRHSRKQDKHYKKKTRATKRHFRV